MPLTSEGLTIKRFPEIKQQLDENLKANYVDPLDISENSVIGNLHVNFATSIAEVFEFGQGIWDAQNLYNAEGEGLDNIALQVGITRNQATRSVSTSVQFTGLDGTAIPKDSRIVSVRGDEFYTDRDFVISSTLCLETRVYIAVLVSGENYGIRLDDVDYFYAAGVTPTYLEILNGLKDELLVDGSVTPTVVVDPDSEELSYLHIDKVVKTSTMSVTGSSYLYYDYVVTPSSVRSVEFGQVAGDAFAVNSILTGVSGWYGVVNPEDFILGASLEDDIDLRKRIFDDFSTVGAGTVDSIGTNVKRVPDVADAVVIENTSAVEVDGIPPKSYEVVVYEGIPEPIAQSLWSTKPAGIYMEGDVSVQIKDFNGYDQVVRFSRPTEKYIFINVQYSVYNEEDFPAGTIDQAKLAMLVFGDNNHSIDDDVIAKRFLGPLYTATTGFGNIEIEVGTSTDPNIAPSTFSDEIPVSLREVATFATNRMTFTPI
tara:strand:- start:119 stop:1570 length:1452 start_codon:yes stop_codon:yes gene_type:complete